VKLLFAPIGILGGILAGFISKSIFDFIWARISDEEAPEPDQRISKGPSSWPHCFSRGRSSD
jgi:hypothetical protein